MFTRAELAFKSRACLAQMKLRIVAFSIALVVPAWLGLWFMQRLNLHAYLFVRVTGSVLLFSYIFGVLRIFRRTLRDHELICPHCQRSLGLELGNVTAAGACKHCDAKLIK